MINAFHRVIMKYSASIVYNQETLKELSKTVNNTFRFGQKACYVIACLALLITGCVIGLSTTGGILCAAFACLLLPSVKVMDSRRAAGSLRQLGSKSMTVRYIFREDGYICSNEKEHNEFHYVDIVRLVSHRGCLYLFPNRNQAMMIDKKTLKPDDEDGFKEFLTKKTGLAWTKPMSIFTISLKQIRFNQKNTRPDH